MGVKLWKQERRRRRRYAAPFVVTLALTGCGSPQQPEATGEPVQPPPITAAADAGAPTPPPAVPDAAPAVPDAAPAVLDLTPAPTLLPAPDDAFVNRRSDGTCWYREPMRCKPKVRCNPPPPRQVQCPPGQGKSDDPLRDL